MQTLVTQALADSSLVKGDVIDTIEEMIARLDEKLTAQMNEILHAPEFQQLESAWRGLHYLVFNSETDATLEDPRHERRQDRALSQSEAVSRRALGPEPAVQEDLRTGIRQLGGEPYGALVADYHFSHSPTDVSAPARSLKDRLGRAGAAGHRRRSQSARHGFLDRADESARHRQADGHAGICGVEGPARRRRSAAIVALCMPRVLSRLPYGAKSEPVEEFAFEEDTDGHKGEKYGWMNAAYAMAANINRAYKEYGWTVRIRGVQSGGEVINLPTHTFPTDDGGVDLKCPTEIAITDRREAELSKAGLISIIHRKNTDKAAFIGAQSVYKPKKLHRQAKRRPPTISPRAFPTCSRCRASRII